MNDPDWIELADVPSIADERWAFHQLAQTNGTPTPQRLEPASSWQPINLADLPDHPPVEPTLGNLGIAYPGKRHVYSGPQESAKTLAAYILALELARNAELVVLIDFEMGRWDARNRLVDLNATHDDLRHIHYVEPHDPARDLEIAALLRLQPALVIIDAAAGAYDLQGLDDNRRADVERFTSTYIKAFWLAEIATIVLDHVVKQAEGRGTYAIGSERKVGGADVHLGFETILPIKRGSHGKYKIVTHKDRMGFLKRGKLAELDLVSDPDSNHISWDLKPATDTDEEHPFRPTVKMEQASRWLEKQLAEQVPMSHIENGIGGDREAGRLAIQILVDDGYFRENLGPRNARLMTLQRPYREEYDTPPLHLSGPLRDLSAGEVEATSPLLHLSVGEVENTEGSANDRKQAKTRDLSAESSTPHLNTYRPDPEFPF